MGTIFDAELPVCGCNPTPDLAKMLRPLSVPYLKTDPLPCTGEPMSKMRLHHFGTCLITLFSLTNCSDSASSPACTPGEVGCNAAVGGNSFGGSSTGGATQGTSGAGTVGGNTAASGGQATTVGGKTGLGGAATGGRTGLGGATGIGGKPVTGGTTGLGGATVGGRTGSGGAAVGGRTGSGGSPVSGGTTGLGGNGTGGTTGPGGATNLGGAPAAGGQGTGGQDNTGGSSGAPAGGQGPEVDEGGKPLATPGDETTESRGYLNLGDFRLLNNRWGSDELNCSGTTMRVFANTDSLGWDFNRGVCDTSGKNGISSGEHPDYPEVEFGVHPFGKGSALATSPDFSSTTVLPLQIKDISTASVTLDNLNMAIGNAQSWNLNFEMWFSERNPITDPNPGVYAEIMTWWGWDVGRWPCDVALTDRVSSADKNYALCHQSDTWAGGKWRYYQFRVDGGPWGNFSGKIDVKPFLDYVVNSKGYSSELWVTRFEIGSEIDDNTSGTVTLKNITVEVNGTTKSPRLAE
jgi:hypothetical protein